MQPSLHTITVLLVMIFRIEAFRFVGWGANCQLRRRASHVAQERLLSSVGQSNDQVFTSISFFRFTNVGDEQIERAVNIAKNALSQKNIKGTLLLSNEGYNGQFAVPVGSVPDFRAELESVDASLFGDLDVNIGKTVDYSTSQLEFPFKRLIVRKKKGALTDGLSDAQAQGIDWTKPGPEMAPEKWHEAIRQFQDQEPVVLGAHSTLIVVLSHDMPCLTCYPVISQIAETPTNLTWVRSKTLCR